MPHDITIPPEFIEVAKAWHDGESSKLYEVGASGCLAIGNQIPWGCNNLDDWQIELFNQLECEIFALIEEFSDCQLFEEIETEQLKSFYEWTEQTRIKLCALYREKYDAEPFQESE